MPIVTNIIMGIISVLINQISTDDSKKIITDQVNKLIGDKDDGITAELAYTMLNAIVTSELNDVTPGMVSKALGKLKDAVVS